MSEETATFTLPMGTPPDPRPGTVGTMLPRDAADQAAAAASTPEKIEEALTGTMAGGLKAVQARLSKATKQFGIPGWLDASTGQHALVLEAKPIRDRKEIRQDVPNEAFIVQCTRRVLARDDNGTLIELDGGWAGVARELGLRADVTLGEAVRKALGSIEDDGSFSEMPLRVDGLAEQLLQWQMGRRSQIEQALGE